MQAEEEVPGGGAQSHGGRPDRAHQCMAALPIPSWDDLSGPLCIVCLGMGCLGAASVGIASPGMAFSGKACRFSALLAVMSGACDCL